MRRFTPVNKLAVWLSGLAVIILVLVPFHAFLTVWLSSATGHYTLVRLWKEILLVPITLGSLYLLIWDKALRGRYFSSWLVRLILLYALVLVISAAAAYAGHSVSAKAMWYGLLADLRFLVFFLDMLVLARYCGWLEASWQKILLIPAVLVAAFAILQYLVLPYDFLRHFGYSDSTIQPYETINHNLNHIRVMSTLRGANPLGAYLILPIAAAAAGFVWQRKQRWNIGIFGAGLLAALAFSFSRSAWLGTVLAIACAVWLAISSAKLRRVLVWSAAGLLVVVAAAGIALRDNLNFENYVFHTDHASKITSTSDQGHSAAFKSAIHDIARQPLGGGVGTAGPQSVYNHHPARIAENYFLQIGQEAGIIGLLLFIAINIMVGRLLLFARARPLALVMFASLAGVTLVNLLSHAWSDDTLAYFWWGFAGIALSPVIMDIKHNHKNGQKIQKTPQRSRPIH